MDGRSAKEGARQEGGVFEGVYVLNLSLLKTSKSCGYPFKNQETTGRQQENKAGSKT
jgi:hypothetical protein